MCTLRPAADSSCSPSGQFLARRTDESLDESGDIVGGGVQGEVATIDDVDFGFRDIAAIGLRLGGVEGRLILTPDHQQARLVLAHPRLPFRVGIDVGAVVVEEVALNVGLSGLIQKIKFVDPEIGVVAFDVGIIPRVAGLRGCKRQEIGAQRAFVRSAIGPKGAPRFPVLSETGVVCDRVLDDESIDSVRVGQDHAKADGATVILHVEGEVGETERFGEVIHDFRDVIEGVREFFRVRPVAVTEARVIGRDQVIAIGKTGKERLEHSRGRRQTVEQENGRSVFRTRLPVENRQPIDLCGAINNRILHGMFLLSHMDLGLLDLASS